MLGLCKKNLNFFDRIQKGDWVSLHPSWGDTAPPQHPPPDFQYGPRNRNICRLTSEPIFYAQVDLLRNCTWSLEIQLSGLQPRQRWIYDTCLETSGAKRDHITPSPHRTILKGNRYNLISPKSVQRYVEELVSKRYQIWPFLHIWRPQVQGRKKGRGLALWPQLCIDI